MGYFDDTGYLNLNISLHTITLINVVICSISSLIVCAICITAFIIPPRASRRLEASFLVSSITGFLYNVVVVLSAVMSEQIDNNHPIELFITLQSFGMFYLSILCTFILKLYFSFKSSAFEMSRTLIRWFSVIVVMFFALNLTLNMLFCFFEVDVRILSILTSTVYIAGCFLAVWFFANNLLKLAKLQCTTSLHDLSVLQNDVKLSVRQQKLVDLATKSMMLFAIQMGSTILCIVILATGFPSFLRSSFVSIDIIINLLCSYYQFAFAQKHYRKCCGFCDDKFEDITIKWIKRRIFVFSLSKNQAETHMANIQSASMDTKTIQSV